MPKFNLRPYLTGRLLAVLLLGFASGLPLALTGSTLQAWFTEANINIVTIGALSLVGLPYTLKFIWAPLMDYVRFPRFGTRKCWMLLAQAGLVVSLLLLANMQPGKQAYLMGLVALAIAFFSASQDISVTAYQVDVLLPEERGLGVASYVFAYRMAMMVSGALALIGAAYFGWKIIYEVMALLMLAVMLMTFRIPPVTEIAPAPGNFFTTLKAAFGDLLQHEKIMLVLAFIMFYKFGDALALQLMTNFLLHGLGFTLTEIGVAYKLVSIIALIAGAFVGGILLTRWSIYRALLVFGIAQSFSNLLFAALAIVGKHFVFMAGAVFIENFCSGLSTAALFTFMMTLCNKRYTATQFALLSTFASIGRVFLGPLAGVMVIHLGWAQFFVYTFIICYPGIAFLMLLKNKVSTYAPAAINP